MRQSSFFLSFGLPIDRWSSLEGYTTGESNHVISGGSCGCLRTPPPPYQHKLELSVNVKALELYGEYPFYLHLISQ